MTNKEKIVELKKCREALIFIKEHYYYDNENNSIIECEKPKVLVLRKKFYGKDLVVG